MTMSPFPFVPVELFRRLSAAAVALVCYEKGQADMDKHLVFVYGTLRRGGAGAMPIRFPDSKFIGGAKVCGSLYDLGAYPGLLLNESDSSVSGEVYEVDDETLKKLDDFEASSHYCREQVEISLGSHGRMCWTYEPDPEFYSPRTLITSGDWVEYAKAKTG
jgi:gamma-glutamylcyclotransferase (GGCT)/AIG2-like uncharacterized protein YtfP